MSKHRVLSFKPQLRLEWRGQDGQNETEQPDHSASLGDSITSSTRIRFSVQTVALPSAFSDLRNGHGNAGVDLLRIEAWRQRGVGEVHGFGLLADKQYTGQMLLQPFGLLNGLMYF
jgi:hypothetical protein